MSRLRNFRRYGGPSFLPSVSRSIIFGITLYKEEA